MYASKYDQKSVFECFAGRVVHDEQGKITQKLEVWAAENGRHEQHNYRYFYDAKGRLATVYRNGLLMEAYVYNADGQRIRTEHLDVNYTYGKHGWLNKAGDLVMRYDASGQLATRENNERRRELERLWARNPRLVPAIHQWGRISFTYEKQKLVQAVLPSMSRVRYEYEHNSVMPTHIYLDNKLAWQCQWCDAVRPLRLLDVMQGISYEWIYNEPNDFLPIRIFVQGKILENLGVTSGVWGADRESFLVAFDQVGSLRGLINSAGKVVKRIDYDSFGNVLHATLPEFFIPQGFASGMTDPFTGLVKFGYRYYDPQVGRFITKDPAKDMRGDGDLYDYCVDDPIGRVDPDGRFFFALPLVAQGAIGALGGLGAGLGIPWLIGEGVDAANDNEERGKPSAADTVEKVAPLVAASSIAGKGIGAAIPLTVNPTGQVALGEFTHGFIDPNPPSAPVSQVGALTKEVVDDFYTSTIKPIITQKSSTSEPVVLEEKSKQDGYLSGEEKSYIRSPAETFLKTHKSTLLDEKTYGVSPFAQSGQSTSKKNEANTKKDRGYLLY